MEVPNDLTCPLTLDLYKDPISVPCCGQTFSRVPLVQALQFSPFCPLCKKNLNVSDVLNIAKNVYIADRISVYQAVEQKNDDHRWRCEITPISVDSSIAEMKLSLDDSKFNVRPSLFIAVLDESSSMSGKPMNQVRAALRHIIELAKSTNNVKLVMINYASSAREIQDASQYGNGGGTNFRAAFNCIEQVLCRHIYSDDEKDRFRVNNVSAVDIAFLTDGQDGSGFRARLIPELKEMLQKRWGDHPLRIHTIGFTNDCDQDLLEAMREAGSIIGVFRYAESDDNERMCLADMLESNKALLIELTEL